MAASGPLGCCKTLPARFRKTACSNPPAFHYCVSGTFITHACTLAIGFSLSFSTCRLYPRQNLLRSHNPFKSAPPRLTSRLHLPFSNPQTTSANTSNTCFYRETLIFPSTPVLPIPLPSRLNHPGPTCGYRLQYMVRWLCPLLTFPSPVAVP
jgi:hypothetical protein